MHYALSCPTIIFIAIQNRRIDVQFFGSKKKLQLLQYISALVVCCAMSGCITPENTRFPTFFRAHPLSERASYEQSDPLTDPAIGPSTEARPRDFARPRTIERRAAQQRLLRGLPREPEAIPPTPPGRRYPAAVN